MNDAIVAPDSKHAPQWLDVTLWLRRLTLEDKGGFRVSRALRNCGIAISEWGPSTASLVSKTETWNVLGTYPREHTELPET